MALYKTFRRIQVIVALAMILSMIVGVPVVQADKEEWPNCKFNSCNASDVRVVGLWLGDADGNPLTGSCKPGEVVNAVLYADMSNGTSDARRAVRVLTDVYVDGELDRSVDDCVLEELPANTTQKVKLADVQWTCGSVLTLPKVMIGWMTSAGATCASVGNPTCTTYSGQCWTGTGLQVQTPPVEVDTYSLSGAKWNDVDGNGLWDEGEPTLAGWTIELRDATNALITTAATDATGAYRFDDLEPGTYIVAEVQQAGWTQTFPAAPGTHSVTISDADVANVDFGNQMNLEAPTYRISGAKWNDLNGDGLWDDGEPTLAGWTIELRDATNALVATAVTDANGAYAFTGLDAATYTVSEVQQTGWTQTFPAGDGIHSVTISDADVANVDFGNYRDLGVVTYSLSGAKWNDVDGDGVWDDGEKGLAGWEITLTRGDLVRRATTAADGAYRFDGLEPGTYVVAETQQTDWTQTFPPAPGTHSVTISDVDITGVNFGNRANPKAPANSISGFKWHDDNENAVWDGGEPGIGGWTIQLLDSEGSVLATAVTDASGAYRFDNLEPGTYIVAEVQQTGWTQTFPSSGTHRIELVEGSITGVNFGNYRPMAQAPTPVPCTRADVAVVVFGGWNNIPVKAWVGGTEQETLYTTVDAFGQQQVMWTFYPPEGTSWNVSVQPQTPDGLDSARWQYELVRIESPSLGTENNNPSSASVSITRCNQYVLYFQLVDRGTTPDVAPTPPSAPGLPVTGSGPEPMLAGGVGLFATLSGLGWAIRRRR
jgi:protocatechuate 3,4-dioxygenase beta subunit